MSRASDVRDGVVTELQTLFPAYTVDKFVLPSYERSDLTDGPRIAVRIGGRDLRLDQGPDETDVVIEVAVIGITPVKQSDTAVAYRAEEIAKCDEFDGLMEQVIALWMNNGTLSRGGIAEHSFGNIEQTIQFDPDRLYREGVYLSMIQLAYRDSQDE